MKMQQGLILKGVGSFYTVLTDAAADISYVCKARGRFRKDGITPVPGDRVEFVVNEDGSGYIEEIAPRRNLMIRPAVANLDKLIVVISAGLPQPDFLLVDKLLIQCELNGICPVLVANKTDSAAPGALLEIEAQYKQSGYRLIYASAVEHNGMEEIRCEIAGSVCCFAGQSAVGKSSILNALLPQLTLPVGELSHKTERGRHTTRHAELWPVYGGAVLDTPGFSLLELPDMEPWELYKYYPEMREKSGECRFAECLHISEPDCAVKPIIGNEFASERYDRYKTFVEELKEKRKHKYD